VNESTFHDLIEFDSHGCDILFRHILSFATGGNEINKLKYFMMIISQ